MVIARWPEKSRAVTWAPARVWSVLVSTSPVRVLDHGVPASQRLAWRDSPDAGAGVVEVVGGPVQAVAERTARAGHQLVDLAGALLEHRGGCGQHRAGAQVGQLWQLVGQEGAQVAPRAAPQLGDPFELLAHVGHEQLRRVGGGGRADVGDQVEQRGVRLVPDRGDDRGGCLRHDSHEPLVGERQQVLDGSAAARDDDDVHAALGVEPLHRLHHLASAAGALHGGVPGLEGDRGPPAARVLQHVALGGRAARGHQTDAVRQERQALLALPGEEALGRQQLAAALETGQQLTEPDHADVVGDEAQRAAVGVVARTAVDDDARALDHRRVGGVDDLPLAGDRHGDVAEGVAQHDEDRCHALAAVELGDLALDPDRAEAVDPAREQRGDLPDGSRLLGAGLECHAGTLAPTSDRPPTMGA